MEEPSLQQIDIQQGKNKKPRPLGLSILLIFTFVFNGLMFGAMLTGFLSRDLVQEILQQHYKQLVITNRAVMFITGTGICFAGISLAGIVMMWLMRRIGFYLFAAGQLIFLISLVFVLKSFDIINISIALFIILLIGAHLKMMR